MLKTMNGSFGSHLTMNKTKDMPCTSCQKTRHQLKVRKSKLLPNMTLYLCSECFENKREPRFAIILAGRERGIDAIAELIRNHRYVGKDITLRELV
jgi:hypothetical protein